MVASPAGASRDVPAARSDEQTRTVRAREMHTQASLAVDLLVGLGQVDARTANQLVPLTTLHATS